MKSNENVSEEGSGTDMLYEDGVDNTMQDRLEEEDDTEVETNSQLPCEVTTWKVHELP